MLFVFANTTGRTFFERTPLNIVPIVSQLWIKFAQLSHDITLGDIESAQNELLFLVLRDYRTSAETVVRWGH